MVSMLKDMYETTIEPLSEFERLLMLMGFKPEYDEKGLECLSGDVVYRDGKGIYQDTHVTFIKNREDDDALERPLTVETSIYDRKTGHMAEIGTYITKSMLDTDTMSTKELFEYIDTQIKDTYKLMVDGLNRRTN